MYYPQEAGVLRRKVEELEHGKDLLKKQVKELTDKVSNATVKTSKNSTVSLRRNVTNTNNNLADEKIKVCKQETSKFIIVHNKSILLHLSIL